MAGNRAKSIAHKVKDKWKSKEWYKVHAPRMFNEIEVGETPSASVEMLYGRTVDVTINELTGDYSKQHIKMNFKISKVEGYDAKTVFIGHEFTSDYIRRLTRRKKTKTDHVVDITTADGYVIRIKTMSIAEKRIQASQEEAMRRCITEHLIQTGKDNKLSDIVKIIISGEMSRNVAKACHTVIPIKRIEIRKSEVLEAKEECSESIMDAFINPSNIAAPPEEIEDTSTKE
ncbi:MAG: 30S ribosomal protein S3ae [archaeon]|nr:30S ribosomal protein S3ae [archaeon]